MSMKHFLQTIRLAGLGALAFAASLTASADTSRLLTEDFSYEAGSGLYNKGGWMRAGGNTEAPIKVTSGSLTYTGYSDTEVGNSVKIGDTKSGEDLMKFFDNNVKIGSGVAYASMLINVESINNGTPTYFFGFFPETKAGLSDGKAPTEYGRIFAKAVDDTHYQLALGRGGASDKTVTYSTNLDYGTTYLVVIKYQIVEGYTNDVVSMWVNPATTGTEPTSADVTYSGGTDNDPSMTSGGLKGVVLRQGTTASAIGANLQIDALRCATTWTGLFGESGSGDGDAYTATIEVTGGPYYHESAINGTSYTADAYVSVTGATEPVTITCADGVTCERTSISVDELTDVVKVTFTITPTLAATGEWSSTATLSTTGAEDNVIQFGAYVTVPISIAQAVRFQDLYSDDNYNLYQYTGKAVVTYVERVNDYGYEYDLVYAQDLTGAVCFTTAAMSAGANSGIKVGDELTDCLVMISPDATGWQLMFLQVDENVLPFTVSATDKTKTPIEINPADFDPALNQYKLVKLTNVQFSDTGNFEAKSYSVTVGDSNASVRPFANTDLIGTEIPATQAEVTGISKSKSACIVWPRSLNDISAGAATAEITTENLFDFTTNAAPVNEDTLIANITVKATGIKAAAPIILTGDDAAMFSVSPSEIPVGNSTTVVAVTYHPTVAGKHNANIYFDFDGTSSELNHSMQIRGCKAYDPANPPTLSLEPNEVTLTTNVGGTATATAILHVANAFDYINVTKGNDDVQGIIINSSMFVPSVAEQTVSITFQPRVEGNVDQTFTFTTLMGEPVVLTVHGITADSGEEEPTEGGSLTLDATNPYTYYTQDFTTVEKNKPLDLPEWCNVAEEGKRAWWGYVGDDFYAAKVTAYDSKINPGEGTPCKMLLVSPALNYKDATDKTLKFSLMGKGLYEGMTDLLEVCLVETVDGEVYITPMQGFEIPVVADMDDTWIKYEVDMSIIDDMPDVFWIGYRFTSTRGRDNAAQYFITDFSWSKEPSAVTEIIDNADGSYTVYNLQGICVLRTNNAADVNNLPAGLYIINGRKQIIR